MFPYMAGLGPAIDTSKSNPVAALQMGQGMQQQNPMVSAIQSQYSSQLQAYQQSQQQFSDWAKKYEQYEKQQQLAQAALLQQQQQLRRAPPARSLMQTGAETAKSFALEAREKALAARGKALAAREEALRK